jgi:phenylacetate-CoA ligase
MIQKQIKDLLGVTCKVRLVEPKTLARSEGKASGSSTTALKRSS